MKAALPLLACLMLVAAISCVGHKTVLYGIGETTTVAVFGDGSATNTVLGDSLVYKNSTATKILANMTVSLAGAFALGNYQQSQEITKQMANAGANKVQITQATLAAQTAAAKLNAEENAAGINAGLFKVGETIFKQK